MAAKLYREGIEAGSRFGAQHLLDLLLMLSRSPHDDPGYPAVVYYAVTALTPLSVAKRAGLPPKVIAAFEKMTKNKSQSLVFLSLKLAHGDPDEKIFPLLPAAAVEIILRLEGKRAELAPSAAVAASAAAPPAAAVVVRAPSAVRYLALPKTGSLWVPLLLDGGGSKPEHERDVVRALV